MRRSCLFLLTLELVGCISPAVQQLQQEADPLVGKDFWTLSA
jgi:hypothetical protein